MARRGVFVVCSTLLMVAVASPAFACGGLIGPRGSVNLIRTSTLAAYHGGIEHYVTSFEFSGVGGGKFGSLVPLPGVPTKVQKAGKWTLQRLEQEVDNGTLPGIAFAASATLDSAPQPRVLLEAKVDALDITVLEGGARSVGEWALKEGFQLTPDSPEVLEYYARRSPIFMAVRFNTARAKDKGLLPGDGIPVHVTIPTPNPWVPLRILGLGKEDGELVEADVFLLTDRTPSLLPAPDGLGNAKIPSIRGMFLARSERASKSLLKDLRSDRGMSWLPAKNMWFQHLRLNSAAANIVNDLAIDASGAAQPSWVAAGLTKPVGVKVRPISRPVVNKIVKVLPPPALPVADAKPADPTVAMVGLLALGLAIGSTATTLLRRGTARA